MARKPPPRCLICGREPPEVERISRRGRCLECAEQLMTESVAQMQAHSGPVFALWRERIAASVGAQFERDPG